MKIAVLLGGTSAERDVSLVTGLAVAKALLENGHQVEAIDCAYGARVLEDLERPAEAIIAEQPSDIEYRRAELDRNVMHTIQYVLNNDFDVVYNGLHGGYGENGQLQSLLELAGIPYTGSGPLASGLGMNKHLSKILFRNSGVPTADWQYYDRREDIQSEKVAELGFPVVVKPNDQGSTVGLSIVERQEELKTALEEAFRHSCSVVVEKYVPGRELTVSILGQQPLPIIEIRPKSGFYDYKSKYQKGLTDYLVPAPIPGTLARTLKEKALSAYNALGCEDYARIDFRLQEDGQFFCLEVNTLPGMTPTSLVPKAARAVGITFNELVERIVHSAVKRGVGKF